MTREYCPRCRETQPVIETVAWQNDICSACSQEIPPTDADDASEETSPDPSEDPRAGYSG